MEEERKFTRLAGIIDRLAVRQRQHETAADEEDRQRRDECRCLQDGHEHAVEQPDRRPQQQTKNDRGRDPEIEKAR
ncbi:hypothetical protein D9M73_280180 [compost metagenome]